MLWRTSRVYKRDIPGVEKHMLSWSRMLLLLRLLLGTICFSPCSAELSDPLPGVYKPSVIYTSPNSAFIRWEKLQPDQKKDGYVIEYGKSWQHSKTLQVSKDSTAAMISNLDPDTLYNIRVRVPDVSNGGTHPGPSVSFRTRPDVSPSIGVPQNVAVVPLPLYKLQVAWDLPYRARASDVVHYNLVFAPVYSPYLRKTSLLLPGHYKSFKLTYLRPNALYKVKIAALLKSRKGPYSSWVIAQTVGQVRLDNAAQPTTIKQYSQTERPGITKTSSSFHSTTKTATPGLHVSPTREMERKEQTTPYQTKEQSTKRPITKSAQGKESTTRKTTVTLGYITEMTEHSTQSSTQGKEVDRKLETTRKIAEGTTLPVTVPSTATLQTTSAVPSEREIEATTSQTPTATIQTTATVHRTTATAEQERDATTQQTTPATIQTTTMVQRTPVPPEQETDATLTQQTTPATIQTTTTVHRTTVPPEQETDATQQTTPQTTPTTVQIQYKQTPAAIQTTATIQITTVYRTTVSPEQETGGTTQQTTPAAIQIMTILSDKETDATIQQTTPQTTLTTTPAEQERDGTTQETHNTTTATPTTLPRTTTEVHQTATATTSSPLQHTEQVMETTTHHKTPLTTEKTNAQTTVKLNTTPASLTPRKTTPKHETQPTETTTLKTTEVKKLSTEQTMTQPKAQRQTTTQPPRITTEKKTERMTQGTLRKTTTQANAEQTTQKPTSSHEPTSTASPGTTAIPQPTTPSVSPVTDQQVTDSQLFSSTAKPRNTIITPLSSTMPTLVITGTLPTTRPQGEDTCERLKPSMCSDIGYQATKMTSKEGQKKMMDQVRSVWSHLTPLCQSHGKLKQFLCAASFPYCSKSLGGPFLPCRSMCMSTKKSCNMNGEDWPADFNCSKFPDVGESAICISYGHESTASTPATLPVTQWSPVPPSKDPTSEFTTSTLATKNPTTVETKPLPSHCQPLYLKACENVGYKAVQYPNYFNQTHQNDAGVKISKYWPLIEVNCSPLLRLFLCSLYTPICTSKTTTRNVLPCRSLCQQVSKDCSYLMKVYGFEWPEGIKCEDFPDVNDGTCLTQGYLTSQGKESALPTAVATSRESQVTIHRSSTKAILLTLPGAISIEEEMTTVKASPSAAKPTSVPIDSTKPTSPIQPKTGKVLENEQVEDSTEAVAQRNEELMSFVKSTTSASVNRLPDQLSSTKPSSISSPTSPVTISPPSGCERLYLKICQGVGYDFTQFPNFFNHKHQNDAGRALHRFWPLVETSCSPKLQLFLCSLYVPMCTKTPSSGREIMTNNIPPCRSLCYQVKQECRTMMKLYGIQWPRGVECATFPTDGEETCIYGKSNDTDNKGLFKKTRAKATPTIPSKPLPGTARCQPLPSDHPCKNHYNMASVSNASESFESIKKLIEDHISKIKDSASKKCLRNLVMFLCSVNAPRCSNGTIFGPCRSQCKTTFRRCGGVLLRSIDLQVVDLRDCRRFPATQCTTNKRKSKPKNKSIESF